jgi:lipoate-protein ligase B
MIQTQVLDLGVLDYSACYEQMRTLVADRSADRVADTLMIVEHPPVFTRGRKSRDESNLLDVGDVPVVQVERGGDVTFHGPGQLVLYPIFKLQDDERDAPKFIRRLEQWMIEALETVGLPGGFHKRGFSGVWVNERKLASVGVAVTVDWVTWHGIAVNLSTDLRFFDRINPCGLDAQIMGSVHSLTSKTVTRHQMTTALLDALPPHLGRESDR